MSWWSKVKGFVRLVVRVTIEAVHHFNPVLGGLDTLFGFAAWPRKKLRIHVIVLADANGHLVDKATGTVIDAATLKPALDYIKTVYDAQFNIEVRPFAKGFVDVMTQPAPPSVLEVDCGWSGYKADYSEMGDFFATHLAGWNALPISFLYPITVYVVQNINGKQGCSNGPFTDYVVIDTEGVINPSVLAHEVGHSCGLWHSATKSNLMYAHFDRGSGSKWFQRNFLRASRHVLYW